MKSKILINDKVYSQLYADLFQKINEEGVDAPDLFRRAYEGLRAEIDETHEYLHARESSKRFREELFEAEQSMMFIEDFLRVSLGKKERRKIIENLAYIGAIIEKVRNADLKSRVSL